MNGSDEFNEDSDTSTEAQIRRKITFILTQYPCLSPSMLQIGLGTNLAPMSWKPILNQMIVEGVVIRSEDPAVSPTGQSKFYTKLRLRPENVAA